MTDLVSWLTARLDADEQVARAAADAMASHGGYHDVGGMCDVEFDHIDLYDPTHALGIIAAHRAILAEHAPVLRDVEWPHDTTGKGQALVCPRCQNADHTEWHPAAGQAGELPEGFVAPYVLAPCPTLRDLASIYADRDGYDPSWKVEEQ